METLPSDADKTEESIPIQNRPLMPIPPNMPPPMMMPPGANGMFPPPGLTPPGFPPLVGRY